uniref:Uncharacterized protein n=1 Tax=Aegilops tauschii subsp. strangulata TaxID=200361 RepID=A0A453GKQ8_AEGTS
FFILPTSIRSLKPGITADLKSQEYCNVNSAVVTYAAKIRSSRSVVIYACYKITRNLIKISNRQPNSNTELLMHVPFSLYLDELCFLPFRNI